LWQREKEAEVCMYNGIGLSTPRGSGTNGYIQKNLGFVKPRPKIEYRPPPEEEDQKLQLRRKPNQEILEHEKKRELELHVMMWAEEQHLFDGNLTEEEIEAKLALKRALLQGGELEAVKRKKSLESHQYRVAQEEQAARFQEVFKINKSYTPGSAFDEKKTERRTRATICTKIRTRETENPGKRRTKKRRKEKRT